MSQDNSVVRLEDYIPTPYSIDHVSLTVRLDPLETFVTSTLSIAPREGGSEEAALTLDGDDLVFVSARLNGDVLEDSAYSASDEQFILKNPPQEAFTLELVTKLAPQKNTQLMGLYRSNGAYCTQCEAEGFRRITYFYDRPDVLSVYDVRIEAPVEVKYLLANGNLVDSGTMSTPEGYPEDQLWHYACWQDPFPKPSYLFALVAGDLARVEDRFVTRSGRDITLHIYVEHGKEDRVDHAMDSLKRSMKWDEDVFDREYDLDIFMIVAVSDFNMGAMENKGLNVFNDKYVLAKPETATDTDYALIEGVIAHEYFHNWTGNRITCRDWFQLCLKEGLTVFRDQEFSSDMRSRPVKRISDVQQLRARQFPEDSGPLAHQVRPEVYSEINNFYTSTVYEKGAEVCRMLETLLGKEGFKAGLDLYFDRFDGQAVTIEDFIASFEEACSVDLSQFALWYRQAGTPDLVATYSYDAAREQLSLSIEQSCPPTPGQPTKKVMHIPVRFGLVGRDGSPVGFTSVIDANSGQEIGKSDCTVLEIRERQHKFILTGVSKDAIPSLLRGFSAPVHLRTNLTHDDYLCLMGHDTDPFNRWEAAQFILMDHLVQQTRALQAGANTSSHALDDSILEALKACLMDDSLEHAFRAQLLQLPIESDVGREIGHDVDPDAIHRARESLRHALSTALGDSLIDLYKALDDKDTSFRSDASSAGRRALRNGLLDLALARKEEAISDLAVAHYHNATNMTDRFAALASLTRNEMPAANALLDAFHAEFTNDALVIDKWLSLQASAPQEETLQRVKDLLSHPSFSMNNPNRVRSLIGAFAMNNQVQFNRKDGEGFKLVADIIIELDKSNPQTAARLANNFRSWKALEPDRQGQAKKELLRIANTESLSKDVADIANRCLQ
ncbi:aminopeptidase N [Cohaesibacter marisflavi]|uniref:Aminopeptidase N n=1 Tax=Cohaesibacter marisflavi TaxID=655353 RepID=A0A1I5A604_9HYPH|nr:aminopeptidase N [Cohaesibacter marisflavi]SFN57885.1 aminopeptidase N [Cohaesibacter marisflavi]